MYEPSFKSPARRRPSLRQAIKAVLAASGLALAIVAGSAYDPHLEPGDARIIYGPAQSIGDGSARAYVTVDAQGAPTSLGIAMSEAAMSNLPQTPLPGGGVAAAMLNLTLPLEGKVTGFDHATLDWNPAGHEPDHVYTLPHFDFHFYTISDAEQMAIMPSDPQYEAKMGKLPAKQYWPEAYAKIPGGVPMMGAHWVDPNSPELWPTDPKEFTRTFLYGSYDGRFIFYEPMITKAHVESVKTAPGRRFTTPIKIASSFEKPGYFPTQYTIAWNAAAKEYRIALDKLVRRD